MGDLKTERRDFKVVGKYNNKFLDDMLLGVLQEDFILIGADTGVGKTEFAFNMAFHNALDKHVHLFALESDKNEPYYRFLYKRIADKYYAKRDSYKHLDMNYRNYISNSIDVDDLEDEAYKELDAYYKLQIHYRENEFTVETLLSKVTKAVTEGQCDLIIIDHIDYFDLDQSLNENLQVSEIMKVLRNINQTYRIPIVVISHMRKKQNRKQKMPTLEDFMGTSNKAKQVKTVIIIGSDYDNTDSKNGLYSTLFSVPKVRIGGSEHLVGQITYDRKKNAYQNTYNLCRLKNFGEELEQIERKEWPSWASQ